MTTVAEPTRTKRGVPGFAQLQRVGRSLMLPIASLPAAALLLRLGQPDMLGADGVAGTFAWMQPVADVLGAAGNALFSNLPIIFALGVAVGYAKKSDGTTGLAALIGYLVFKGVSDSLSPYVLGEAAEGETQALINYGVLGGIVIGLTAALLYQKYYRIKLPQYLAFFGGRRFVPIVTAGVSVLIAVVGALIYPAFDWLINEQIGGFVTGSTILGAFVFGTLNRLLVPIGLHHLLNSLPWFQFGEYTAADGTVAQGDIFRFLAGDPTAGTFLTGFFPIMMFALPAAALAIVHTAKPAQRKVVAGIMGSAALVSFVTGVTEPLEFAFVFVAYPLYVIHAVLTGTSMALVNALGIRDGFGFSAGAIDYLLNFRIAEMPLLLIPIGLGYAVLYYVLFRFVITRWNLRTPGREDDDAEGAVQATGAVDTTDDARPDASAAEAASVRRAAADTAEAGTPSRTGASGGGGTA
ncbi:PTS system N-acetylglucosamine-specific IIC component, Glc family [Cellulosimicrobium aquatile]|uniref:PTS N-acetylglucosamine transporter subunit IIBC n=2 Tax=Cellulosimicrobium TaxID=157920 RepID=A0A4Y8R5A2_9MICO|nr:MULTISPECIES: PTS transporter subunit EIIC [Cellulosimicrobium]QUB98881.1 PTS transporter subunit EIIC [Cellulosimicrobium cellulans]TFF12634.1 PTS N-acetylglucosamine transporter subunit IIBC [Cellulosimicrobium funkei]TGA77247.1 PTS N-acetylglucosamine transporter subunit IIBC [Cellulosimicrobium terreum]SIP94401.1 PTS system N-acetylglucosamine-specific IIC component, Glc family [Cellulosimicrobium aquatile]